MSVRERAHADGRGWNAPARRLWCDGAALPLAGRSGPRFWSALGGSRRPLQLGTKLYASNRYRLFCTSGMTHRFCTKINSTTTETPARLEIDVSRMMLDGGPSVSDRVSLSDVIRPVLQVRSLLRPALPPPPLPVAASGTFPAPRVVSRHAWTPRCPYLIHTDLPRSPPLVLHHAYIMPLRPATPHPHSFPRPRHSQQHGPQSSAVPPATRAGRAG